MTYTDAPNGLTECLPCSFCDPSNGLRVKKACTLISNTVCEPLPGYYCLEFLSNCPKAIKHSTCSPEQYINQTGQSIVICLNYLMSGNHVYWDCSIDTSTTCVACPASTYSDEPSSSSKCFSCSVCEQDRGLRVNKVCTRSSDTVCGPLERFYCIEKKKDCCTLAVQHSECSPGQYIKQAGTGATDNVCADCTGDTYSNGSFSSCLQHTICEALGLTETNPGTHSSDTKCGNPSTVVARITPSVIVTLILIPVIIVFIFKHIRKKKQSKSSGKC
uniref:TNFR-Cys domain-containing protein n=1 Tax=Sinocyclocheilus grahami TaxID=75366 RepID=A0A672NQD0_SINGR